MSDNVAVVIASVGAGLIITLLIIAIIIIVDPKISFTYKRKEKYLKNKEKQIIEQLEFEKDVYVRKVIIDKKLYGYVFFTKIYAWQGKVYPQIFETLDELVDFVKKLEKKGKKQWKDL